MISQQVLDEVLDRTDIVELIASYIPLKRAGRNFKALCPFHNEKTPSFVVSPDKQIYHCFGCSEGGNAFNFLMKHERLEFMEAVEMLAEKAGIQLPRQNEPSVPKSETTKMYSANQLASGFYHYSLFQMEYGKQAASYLQKRGVKSETLKELKIGYAPNSWDALIKHASTKGSSKEALEKAGLILPGKQGSHYDRFRNRIVFPIFNVKGSVIGFGARVLDESLPKYINSPETDIFNKSKHLYGLNFAVEHIKSKDAAIIVEGYLDFLTLYQAGIRNVVAPLGTSLTTGHVRLLKRYSKNVIMVFDSDQAGEHATLRGLDILVAEGMNVKVMRLPEGYDPDSFVGEKGAEEFMKKADEAKGLFEYKLDLLVSRFGLDTSEAKVGISAEILPTVAKVGNAVLKSEYIRRLAERLKLSENAIWTELKKVKPDYSYTDLQMPKSSPKQTALDSAQSMLVGLLLDSPELIPYAKSRLDVAKLEDGQFKTLMDSIFKLYDKANSLSPGKLINSLQDDALCQVIPEVCSRMIEVADKKKTLNDCAASIKKSGINKRLMQLQDEIRLAQNAQEEEKILKLINEHSMLIKRLQKGALHEEEKIAQKA